MAKKPSLADLMIKREQNVEVAKPPPDPADAETRPIQFRVPAKVFEEFSERAGKEFGFTKGAKSRLFLKLWDEFSKR